MGEEERVWTDLDDADAHLEDVLTRRAVLPTLRVRPDRSLQVSSPVEEPREIPMSHLRVLISVHPLPLLTQRVHPDGLFDQVGRVPLQLDLELVDPALRLPPRLVDPNAIDSQLLPPHTLVPAQRQRVPNLSALERGEELPVLVVGRFVQRDVERRRLDRREGESEGETGDGGGARGDEEEAMDLAATCLGSQSVLVRVGGAVRDELGRRSPKPRWGRPSVSRAQGP